MEETHDIFLERLHRREKERLQELQMKKERKDQNSSSTEQISYFTETFAAKTQEIEDALNLANSGKIDKNLLPCHFDKISKDILSVQHFISASKLFLRVYDIRKAQETMQDLQQKAQELEEKLLPKKKFGFKIKRNVQSTKKEPFIKKIEDTVDSTAIPKLQFTKEMDSCGFSGREGEVLILSQEQMHKKDVVFSNLVGCTVRLPGSPSTIHMSSLQNCKILSGPVATSVFIDGCEDCIFVLACQQLRIHNTKRCDFYLHVTSRAIIEDTTQVGFAPYNWKFENIDNHFALAGLDVNRNNWDLVSDFNWLASDRPSPNWSIINVADKKIDWA